MKKVLHVGCGQKRLVGQNPVFPEGEWRETRLDIDPSVGPDIVSSMTAMPMLPDDCQDAVYSAHNLEHLFPHELRAALSEFRRVLKPGGFALVLVPDIQAAAAAIAAGKGRLPLYVSASGPITPFDVLYGHRASIEHGHIHMAHRNGFVIATLLEALEQAGFTAVHAKRTGMELAGMAYKDHRPAGSPRLSGTLATAP
jgi:ubiquinone/menaquinone biosynthesis C-methylase UbiE